MPRNSLELYESLLAACQRVIEKNIARGTDYSEAASLAQSYEIRIASMKAAKCA